MSRPGEAPALTSPVLAESYRVLRSRVDLSLLPRLSRDVTERVIHASADFGYVTDIVCDEDALEDGVAALAAGAAVVADISMVAAGIIGCPVICKISEPLTRRLARTAGISHAAAAARLALGEAGPGAIWVVGGGPDALMEILTRRAEPAFVVAFPVGFTGAVQAKEALRASGLPGVSNLSEKGGPPVAVAAFNALLQAAVAVPGSLAGWGAGGQEAAADQDGTTF